jgi:8-oxo-dGTP diphosphatase
MVEGDADRATMARGGEDEARPDASADANGGERLVLAAGGVVRRRDPSGDGYLVAVVHRPRYDDWSLPKGKLDPGEGAEAGALREVEEETGLRCRVGPEIAAVRYRDRKGRPKQVRYWLMEPIDDQGVDDRGFAPNDEVDELRWCRVADARRLLSYDHDRRLVADLPA